MVDVPGLTPVTTPVAGITVAIPVEPLLHVPPNVASESEVVAPTHTVGLPRIGVGSASTVTTEVVIQVVGNV